MCISLVISWGVGGWIVDEEMTVCVYYSSVSGLLRIDGTVVHLLIFTFYNRELSVQWLYSVYIYELIINGILYNLNEKINQKYTVSFLLSIHLVIWLSYKMHIREANPTKVEKCLWSAKWARIPVYENYVSNEK